MNRRAYRTQLSRLKREARKGNRLAQSKGIGGDPIYREITPVIFRRCGGMRK